MIIGIAGRKQSGKNTVSMYMEEWYGFEQRAFADPIKRALEQIFDWPRSIWDSEESKNAVDPRWGVSPRQMAQHMGTEWGQFALCESFPQFAKTIGRTLWVTRATHGLTGEEDVVFNDMRFLHEAEAIRKLGGYVFFLDRASQSEDAHLSETELSLIKPDYIIVNDGSRDDLYDQVDEIMEELLDEKYGPIDYELLL